MLSSAQNLETTLKYIRNKPEFTRNEEKPTRSTSFLRGGDEEGSLYLGEFPLVSCELGFVFNVFSCRLKDQRRREHCASSFSYQINFFPRWEMRRGSYISVGFSSFLVNSGLFLMYFSVVSRF